MNSRTGAESPSGGLPRRGRLVWRLALAALIVAVLAAAWRFGLFDLLSLETLRERREALLGFVAAHRYAALALFIGVYALATLFALPGVLWITIAGGFLFGLATGALATAVGATLGATGLFLAARYLFAGALRRRAGGFLDRLEAGFQRNAISYLLSLRLIPIVPFFVANIAPAFLGVRTTTFVATTFVGILPGVVAYTWIGAGLGAIFDAGGAPDLASFARQLAPAFIALGLLSLAPVIIGRFRTKPSSTDVKD
ncbi:MAG TPA: TVP38/TMEM64 family protein [Hyphomonadaceae bacterium]|nr:TVP38/TMEM64 family protein [Hyphomonadaceae bacterium]